jgi:hypothetical protein
LLYFTYVREASFQLEDVMKTSKLAEVADDVDEMRDGLDDVRRELRRLVEQLDTAPFVRRELHDEQIRGMRESMGRVASHAQWTFGLLASSIIGAIVVFAITVARGG